MKSFNEYLNEEREPAPQEMIDISAEVEKVFRKYFPNGFIRTTTSKLLGGWTTTVTIGMIGDDRDVSNGIRENDPLHTKLFISPINGGYEATLVTGAALSTNPPEGSYLAMDRVKLGFRKFKGDSKKIVSGFDRFFKKAQTVVKSNADNIYRVDRIPNKYLPR